MDKYITYEETVLNAIEYVEKYPEFSFEQALNIHLMIMTEINKMVDEGYTREELAEICMMDDDPHYS